MADVLQAETAQAALQALLSGIDGLPECRRNDRRLREFDSNGFLLAMSDGDRETDDVESGEPPQYEVYVTAEVQLVLEGEPGAPRDAIFAAAEWKLAQTLWADRTLGGACEHFELSGGVERLHPFSEGGKPCEVLRFELAMLITADTPFG